MKKSKQGKKKDKTVLTEKFLDETIRAFSSKKLLEAATLNIKLATINEMNDIAALFQAKEVEEKKELYGLTVDLKAVQEKFGNDTSEDVFLICIRRTMSKLEGLAVIAHELGHIHGILFNAEKHYNNRENYANTYARKLLTRKLGHGPVRDKTHQILIDLVEGKRDR